VTKAEEDALADAILELGRDTAAAAAITRLQARAAELEPLLAFGGMLGAVYAAELAGLRYALEVLQELEEASPHH
jgi:hypothetical protein